MTFAAFCQKNPIKVAIIRLPLQSFRSYTAFSSFALAATSPSSLAQKKFAWQEKTSHLFFGSRVMNLTPYGDHSFSCKQLHSSPLFLSSIYNLQEPKKENMFELSSKNHL